MSDYANPTALVSAEWAQQHLDDPGVRFVEVDVDTEAYSEGHIPGAVGWNWETQLSDSIRRDIVSRDELSSCSRSRASGRHAYRALRRQQQLVRGLGYWQLGSTASPT